MAKAKQTLDFTPLADFQKKFDLTKRTKREVRFSELNFKLDTRIDGSAKEEFSKELIHNWENNDAALDDLIKYPIEATGDLVVTVGRALATAASKLFATPEDPDPKFTVEVYDEIPSYDKLAEKNKLCLRLYAVKADMRRKDMRRGLKDADKLFNMRPLVEGGWSKEMAIAGAVEAGYTPWKAAALYKKAKSAVNGRNLTEARNEVEVYRKAKEPIPVDKICAAHGLDPKRYGKQILERIDRGAIPVAQNNLIKKQRWIVTKTQDPSEHWASGSAQSIVDNNIDWYRRTVYDQLGDKERPVSGATIIARTEHGLEQAIAMLKLWQDALTRAKGEVARLEPIRKNKALVARLKNNNE